MNLLRMVACRHSAAICTALLAATALVTLSPQMAKAQEWTGGGGDMNWYNAANWDHLPDGTGATMMTSLSDPVLISGGAAVAGQLAIGYTGGAAALIITDGAVLTSQKGLLGQGGGSQGVVTVDNAQWTMTENLDVGVGGTGTLSIANGGTVSVGTMLLVANGNVTIFGAGSSLSTNGAVMMAGAGSKVVLTDGGKLTAGGGTGNLTINSSSRLIIGAEDGQAAAAAGVVEAGKIIFGGGTGRLIFNHTSADFALGAQLSGSGAISQLAGTTILTADSSAFTGTTNIDGGTLVVSSKLGGIVNVNSGGILGGAGTVATVVVDNGGTLAPGGVGVIGTLNATGDVTFNSGSTLLLDFGIGGVDRLASTGAVVINPGATLKIDASIAFNPGGQTLVSGSSLTGQFDTAILAGGDSIADSVLYDGTSIKLQASQSGKLVPAAVSPSGSSAATVLDAARGNASLNNLITVLDALPAPQKAAALNSISGQTTTTMAAIPTNAASSVVATVLNHNAAKPGASAPTRFSSGDTADNGQRSGIATGDRAPANDHGAWASVLGGFGSVDTKNGIAGSNSRTGGFAGGLDFDIEPERITAGVSFGYVGSRTDIDGNGGNASSKAGFLGLYGRLEDWGIRLDGTLMGGRHYAEQSRNITIGTATSTASGENDGWSLGTGLQVSTPVQIARSAGFDAVMRPFAGVTAQRYWQGAWTETGAGTANLAYQSMSRDSVVSRLGATFEFDIQAGKETRLAPIVSLGWAHQFANNAPTMDAAFALLPESRFSVTGAEMARDSLEIGLGIDVIDMGEGLTFTLAYGGSLAQDAQDHTFSGRVKLAL